jgi:glycosyltransferase involved in cell wall biosynthesis
MRIIHGNAYESPEVIDGVNSTIWTIAREQSSLGHDVAIILGQPEAAARAAAEQGGIRLFAVGPTVRAYARDVRRLLRGFRPDVVHLHSTFTPRLAVSSELAVRSRIPLVLTLHGGLRPFQLGRGGWKHIVYSRLVERRRFRRASAVTVLLPSEELLFRDFTRRFSGEIEVIPSPVDADLASGVPRDAGGPIIFLGRLDVASKGLDHWIEIARKLPELRFEMYGEGPDRDWLEARLPTNVTIRRPVFGAAKREALASARLYLQTSRWDAFPIAVGEAMMAGLPCAISASQDLARTFEDEGLGLVLPPDAEAAAALIAAAYADEDQLRSWSTSAQAYAQRFASPAVATAYLELYERLNHRR